jgi:hypothetical protein
MIKRAKSRSSFCGITALPNLYINIDLNRDHRPWKQNDPFETPQVFPENTDMRRGGINP